MVEYVARPTVTVKSLSNDNRDVNKNGKKRSRFNKQNNNFARASCFFVHFFTVAARLQRKKCRISTLTASYICSQL